MLYSKNKITVRKIFIAIQLTLFFGGMVMFAQAQDDSTVTSIDPELEAILPKKFPGNMK